MPALLTKTKALKALQALVEPSFRLKRAEIGGSKDQAFEQAFSSLAHTFIADKAPKLLEYELGFQLIEKNQEGSRAVGVFGFKVGDLWLFAPMFFLNGQLKGHELLYLKNQDLFVPMKESWINYLLGRKPVRMGDLLERNLTRLGVQGPSLWQMTASPYKMASDWKEDSYKTLTRIANESPRDCFKAMPDMETFLKQAGVDTFRRLLGWCRQSPDIFEAFDKHHNGLLEKLGTWFGSRQKSAEEDPYRKHRSRVKVEGITVSGDDVWDSLPRGGRSRSRGPDKRKTLADLIHDKPAEIRKEAAAKTSKPEADPKPAKKDKGVQAALLEDGGQDIRDLTAEEKKFLIKDRYVIRDERDPDRIARAYDVTTDLKLFNPDTTGIYHVLVRPEKFERCLVIMQPWSHTGQHRPATVIALDSKRWVNTHPSRIWTDGKSTDESFTDWWDKLPDAEDSTDGLRVLIGRSGCGTVPFRLRDSHGAASREDYGSVWDVDFRDYSENDAPEFASEYESRRVSRKAQPWSPVSRLRFTGRDGSKIHRRGDGEITVPKGFKTLVLKAEKKSDDESCGCPYGSSDPGALEPGNLADIRFMIQSATYPLRVTRDGSEYTIKEYEKLDKSRVKKSYTLRKEAAIVKLVLDHQLDEKTAKTILDKATTAKSAYVAIKQASPYLTDSAPSAPGIPDMPVGADPMTNGRIPTNQPTGWALPVQDLASSFSRRENYHPRVDPDQETMAAVQQAAQTGEKEIFDTATLGGLLKNVGDDSVIDRNLDSVAKGMNGLGRLLMGYYWHQDLFADRYGKADLSSIEDGLRNSFESSGEIFLTLKAKKVNPLLDEGISAGENLDDVANI